MKVVHISNFMGSNSPSEPIKPYLIISGYFSGEPTDEEKIRSIICELDANGKPLDDPNDTSTPTPPILKNCVLPNNKKMPKIGALQYTQTKDITLSLSYDRDDMKMKFCKVDNRNL